MFYFCKNTIRHLKQHASKVTTIEAAVILGAKLTRSYTIQVWRDTPTSTAASQSPRDPPVSTKGAAAAANHPENPSLGPYLDEHVSSTHLL